MQSFDFLWEIAKHIPGWFDIQEGKAIYNLVSKLSTGKLIVELGSFCGRSSVVIAGAAKDKNKFIMVDDFSSPNCSPEILKKNVEIVSYISANCHILNMKSDQAFKEIYSTIDLLFIDTVHTYEAVKHDINLWLKLVEPGGYVIFHDYGGKYSGVKMAVNEAILQGKLKDDGLFYSLKVTKKI